MNTLNCKQPQSPPNLPLYVHYKPAKLWKWPSLPHAMLQQGTKDTRFRIPAAKNPELSEDSDLVWLSHCLFLSTVHDHEPQRFPTLSVCPVVYVFVHGAWPWASEVSHLVCVSSCLCFCPRCMTMSLRGFPPCLCVQLSMSLSTVHDHEPQRFPTLSVCPVVYVLVQDARSWCDVKKTLWIAVFKIWLAAQLVNLNW